MRTYFPRALLLSILRPSSCVSAFSLTKSSVASKSISASRNFHLIRGGASPKVLNMAERPFQTWSFDNACDTMDWNPDTKVSLVVGDDVDADLVLVGVFAPAKDDDATDTDEEEELG